MHYLLICEDNPLIRRGLKKIVESFGIPLEIYLAKDAEEGLRIFAEHPFDLVMTDIRMPGCDGLELIRRMQTLRNGFQVIVISGYDDFTYARTALQLGISDYLLKPVDPDELKRALEHCIGKLTLHVSQKQILSRVMYEQLQKAWGTPLPEDAAHLLDAAENSFFQAPSFGVFLFHLNHTAPETARDVLTRAKLFLAEQSPQLLFFPVYGRCFCAILGLPPEKNEALPALAEQMDAFLKDCREKTGAVLFCGISARAEGIFRLEEAILQAEQTLCERFFSEERLAFLFRDRTCAEKKGREPSDQPIDLLFQALRLAEPNAVERHLNLLFAELKADPDRLWDCLTQIGSFVHQELEEEADAFHALRIVQDADSPEQLEAHMRDTLLELAGKRLAKRWYPQDPVSQAIRYMEENYDKPLTLTILSNVVSLNYTYFSSIFKSRTGVGVITYLQNLRLQKAKERLVSTDDRIGEIAHRSGFTDERYFEKLFKQSEGVTPREYRRQQENFTEGRLQTRVTR